MNDEGLLKDERSLNKEGLFDKRPSDVAEGVVIVVGNAWQEGSTFCLYWFEALLLSMLEGGRGWFVILRVESMSMVSLISGKTVWKLDKVGNCEVTAVEVVAITEVTTAVRVVGSIGGSSRYSSLSAPPLSPFSSLAAGGTG